MDGRRKINCLASDGDDEPVQWGRTTDQKNRLNEVRNSFDGEGKILKPSHLYF